MNSERSTGRRLALAALALLCLTVAVPAHGQDDGVPGLAGLAWYFETDGAVRTSPVLDRGVMYVASTDGTLYALLADDGRELWRRRVGAPLVATPAVAGGVVYLADRTNTLHAIRAGDGTPLWSFETGPDQDLPWGREGWDYSSGGPVVVGETVYFGSGDGTVNAVQVRDGSRRWSFRAAGRVRAAPSVHGDRLFIGDAAGMFHALDLANGREVWSFATDGNSLDSASAGFDRRQIYSAAVVADGSVYFGSRDAKLYALEAATGTLRWKVDDGGSSWVIAAPMVDGDRILETRSSSTRVRAIAVADGAELWSQQTGSPVFAPAVRLGSGYLAANGAGLLTAYAADGQEIWRYGVGPGTWSAPVVSDDRLYLGSDDGGVYAFDLGADPMPLLRVFRDPALTDLSMFGASPGHARVADHFSAAGYGQLDSAGLVEFLQARIADRRPSAVVFAMDAHNPAFDEDGGTALVRQYMEAGGRVTWLGLPPGVFVRADDGLITAVRREIPSALLGVDYDPFDTDRHPVWPTPAGRVRGLRSRFLGSPRIDPGPETIVLARDDLGRTVAWEQPYGDATSGRRGAFIEMPPSFDAQRLDEIRTVTEYGLFPSPVSVAIADTRTASNRRP